MVGLMAVLELPAPVIRNKERSIIARYDTGLTTPPTEYNREVKKILFTFEVHYTKAGINYFNGERTTTDYYAVTVINETERDGVVGFMVGGGLGLARIQQESNRFSRKKLQQIFDEWRERVEGIMCVPENLLDDSDRIIQRAVMPYWNGTKAGLA